MVSPAILGQVLRQVPKIRNDLERLYAIAGGTAAGIGATPGVKAFYREWISKQDWRNPYKTKRAKGDVLTPEADNQIPETYSPSSIQRNSYRRKGDHFYRYSRRQNHSRCCHRGCRRCNHKSSFRRNMAAKRRY